jgi:hypothetical protein
MNVDESAYEGRPPDDVPQQQPTDDACMGKKTDRRDDRTTVFVGYCRSWPGKGTDHVGEGRCKHHGGATPRGEDSPHFEHGLFSDYLSPEDRQTMARLEEYDDEAKLEELINWRLARLRRAVRALNDGADERTFWEAFEEIINQAGPVGEDEIRELARMLDKGNRAMQQEVDLVRRLIKDHNKIAEGEDVNLAWREALAGEQA